MAGLHKSRKNKKSRQIACSLKFSGSYHVAYGDAVFFQRTAGTKSPIAARYYESISSSIPIPGVSWPMSVGDVDIMSLTWMALISISSASYFFIHSSLFFWLAHAHIYSLSIVIPFGKTYTKFITICLSSQVFNELLTFCLHLRVRILKK